MPNMGLIGNICNFQLSLSLIDYCATTNRLWHLHKFCWQPCAQNHSQEAPSPPVQPTTPACTSNPEISAVKSKASQDWDGFKHNSAVSNMDEPLKWKLQSQNIIKGSSVCSWRCCNQHQRRDHCIYWWLQPLVLKEHQAMCASTTQLKALEECTDWIIWRLLQDHSPKCIHEMSFLETQVQMKAPHLQASAV